MLMRQHSLRTMEAQLAAAPPHLSDDICAEILVRLPVKSVPRFRAVCKTWRDITTGPLFLAAHARRQPAKVVLYTYLDSVQRGYAVDIALDVLPVSGETADQRRLIRYPRSVPLSSTDPLLLDSCNGVLLFRKDAAGIYFLCNPSRGSGPSSRSSLMKAMAGTAAPTLESMLSTSTSSPASTGSCAAALRPPAGRGASSPPVPPSLGM